MVTEDLAWYHYLPFSSIHKVAVVVQVLSVWQEGREQREREPPRLTYERGLLAERLEDHCNPPPRLHVGTEHAEELGRTQMWEKGAA